MSAARTIRLIAFDVDGVLTDGMLYYGPQGDSMKAFSARDGMGISLARAGGLQTAIITGRMSAMVAARARDLHIDHVIQQASQKWPALQELCAKIGIGSEEVAYMGDDLNDVTVLRRVAFGGAPTDGCAEAKQAAAFVSTYAGGHGALREFIEHILKEKQVWDHVLQQYTGGTGTLYQ